MAFADQEGLYRRFARVWHILILLMMAPLAPYFMSGSSQDSDKELRSSDLVFGKCLFEVMTFMGSFAMNLGMSIWVSFIAGVVMYKNLPLHTFGQIQSRLFPFYFAIGTITGGIMFFTTVMQARTLPGLTQDQQFLMGAVATVFICHGTSWVWLGPTSTEIMREKHRMEKEAPDKAVLDEMPDYKLIKKKFGQIHGICSLVNLAAIAGNFYVLYWLSVTTHALAGPKIV